MRLAVAPKSLAIAAAFGFGGIAMLELAAPGGHTPSFALKLALGLLALGCATKLRFPPFLYGLSARLSRLRERIGDMTRGRKPASVPASRRACGPYALPARVAVALAAAARARK